MIFRAIFDGQRIQHLTKRQRLFGKSDENEQFPEVLQQCTKDAFGRFLPCKPLVRCWLLQYLLQNT